MRCGKLSEVCIAVNCHEHSSGTWEKFDLQETAADFESKKVHLRVLSSETCLVPVEENEKRLTARGEYTFITECFFMTHSALELGVKPCLDRLTNLIQDVGRMQELFQTDHQNIRNLFEEGMQTYLIK